MNDVNSPMVEDATLSPAADWYKDAIIYELHVKAFFDANGDGIGDFAGLTAQARLPPGPRRHRLWLLPFFPSPLRDDGYDIADYRDDPPGLRHAATTSASFVREAHAAACASSSSWSSTTPPTSIPGSSARARAKPGSIERDYYVWSDTAEKYQGTRIIFTDTEKSNWTWDPVAQAYYWHRFFSHQPDLNFDNPQVLKPCST